jgi:signal transduction histidine kinase
MTATGFAALAYPLLSQLDGAAAATVGLLLSSAWTIGYVALLLTFATGGRIASPVDAALVATFTLTLLVLQFTWMLFLDMPGNLLLVDGDAQAAEVIDEGRRWLTAVASLCVAIVIGARWLSASRARREALLPSVVGCVSAVLFTGLLVDGLTRETPSEHLWWLANGALLLVPAAYLAGLLRSRLARAGLAPLLLQLRGMRGEELETALARALGDPTLELVRDGAVAPPAAGRSVAPIERDGREIAALVYDDSRDNDPALVEAVTAAGAIALENERLNEESEVRLGELRASRERLVAVGTAERRRLERNLHDGAQQRLVTIALQLGMLKTRVKGDPVAEELASGAAEELARSLEELRELARGLHPAVLDRGLAPALDALAERSPVPTTVSFECPERLPEPVETAAYFVASEALANVGKYARARSAAIRVWRSGASAFIEIADDGVGGADERSGSGLRGLADRVEVLDGHLRVSSPPGAGTTLTAEMPWRAREPA